MLRQHLAEQIRYLADVCVKGAGTGTASSSSSGGSSSGGGGGYASLIEVLLPLLARLVADPQGEVRTAAGDSLVAVAGLVNREDLGPYVLTIVLQLAHDEENEELRMTAVSGGRCRRGGAGGWMGAWMWDV